MTDRPFVLGLTGSIATGKTTTARMFAEAGAEIWSADEAVDRIYRPGGGGEDAIRRICPEAVPRTGAGVDKQQLKTSFAETPELLGKLERAVHPLVQTDRNEFIEEAGLAGTELVVVEIPLLFETGGENRVDAVLLVTAPGDTQRKRVLERGTMTEREFEILCSRQIPDKIKRQRADFVIETFSFDETREEVRDIINKIKDERWRRRS